MIENKFENNDRWEKKYIRLFEIEVDDQGGYWLIRNG